MEIILFFALVTSAVGMVAAILMPASSITVVTSSYRARTFKD